MTSSSFSAPPVVVAANEISPLLTTTKPPTFTSTSTSAIHYGSEEYISNGNGATTTTTTAVSSTTVSSTTTTVVKKIGMLGSMAIAVNSLTGPAMLDLPATFQRSGLIPTMATLIFTCVLSSLCSLHMANTISKYPNNLQFTKEVEFSESFRYFWGTKWFVVTECIFFVCVTCLNISSIVDTAQVVDTFVGHSYGNSGALLLHLYDIHYDHNNNNNNNNNNSSQYMDAFQFVTWSPRSCSHHELKHGKCLAFASYDHDGALIITLGYVVTTLIFLPMALMDLKENTAFQILGFVVLLITTLQFAYEFSVAGLEWSNISMWGTSWDTLFGVILFNFALVIVIPAWLYERHEQVSVPVVIYGSTILSTILYIIVGMFGALAIHHISDNMLESMMSGLFGTSMQIGASIFAFMIVGLGIPLFSVLTRMNLVGSGLTSTLVGNLMAVALPFSVSWMFYQGAAITTLLSWGGVIFTSAVAFLLPLLLALHTVLEYDDVVGSVPVYGTGRIFQSKRAQVIVLLILLLLAVGSIGAALLGQFWIDVIANSDDDTVQ